VLVGRRYGATYPTLGEILIEEGFITEDQLNHALEEQRRVKEPLGSILVKMGLLSEDNLNKALAKQMGVEYISPEELSKIDPSLKNFVPEPLARRNKLVPVEVKGDTLKVAMANPLDVIAMDDVKRATGIRNIVPAISSEKAIENAINRIYGGGEEARAPEGARPPSTALEFREVGAPTPEVEADVAEMLRRAGEQTVVETVRRLIADAVRQRATDIHIEPWREEIRVRYRIDGVLHEIPGPPRWMHEPIVSRIKILSDLDISERRLPQDGQFIVNVDGKEVDIRVSTLPTVFGEKVALRLLDRSVGLKSLTDLGFGPEELAIFTKHLNQPYGLILVVGPTGSGKTTTLYAALLRIKTSEKNMVTVEDPVEYKLEGITQVQTNFKIGLDYVTALRHILRHDPDIIMVGEIRDLETADIVFRASLAGHLTFSTLHANDAISAIDRLREMGVEKYLIASSINLVVAQRLVRRICSNCKVEDPDGVEILKEIADLDEFPLDFIPYKGKGCEMCRGTGYFGRIAICEMLEMRKEIRELVLENAPSQVIREKAIQLGMRSLREDGIRKIRAGITTVSEVLSASPEIG
jgi:type IV pilus assembly protein PilB